MTTMPSMKIPHPPPCTSLSLSFKTYKKQREQRQGERTRVSYRLQTCSLSQSASKVECTPEFWSSEELCNKIEGSLATIAEGSLVVGEEGGWGKVRTCRWEKVQREGGSELAVFGDGGKLTFEVIHEAWGRKAWSCDVGRRLQVKW